MTTVRPQVFLANPRGFCAGVDRAIAVVEQVLAKHGAPIYVKHEIVHNRFVVEDLKRRGVVFVEEVDIVPPKSVLVYSAHGVSQAVRRAAAARRLEIYDATCPLVTKVHAEVARLRKDGYQVVMIGHRRHPETEGTLGQADDGIFLVEQESDIDALPFSADEKIAFVTQTTLSVDDTARLVAVLRRRYPSIRAPRKDDICYATQNRQDAVKKLAAQCEVLLVIGSRASSNSNRLCEVARQCGIRAYLVDSKDDVDAAWLLGARRIGVTAGASAPAQLAGELTRWLRQKFGATVTEMEGVRENIVFAPPRGLSPPPN